MIARGFLVGCSVALCVAIAAAQPKPAEMEQSKQLYEQATADYKLGRFADALAGYEAAHKLYAAPAFLFNIAQCHFQLEHWDTAMFFFEGYLRELPTASNRLLVEDLIKEARERGAAQREAEARKLELEKQRLELERKTKELELRTQRALAQQLQQQRVEQTDDRPVYKKWWFWTIVGGAVAGATVTTLVVTSGDRTVLPGGSLGTWDQR